MPESSRPALSYDRPTEDGTGPAPRPTASLRRILGFVGLVTCALGWLAPPAAAAEGDAPPEGAEAPAYVRAGIEPATQVVAVRLEGPIRIDGVLNEPAWARASTAPLIQNNPDNGDAPRNGTDWWVGYDDDALYVAARMHETAPDSIVCNLGRRDTWPAGDWIFLNLDTFNDDRNAFSFSLNPGGCMGDARLYNDGWDDPSWDGVWDCATRVDSEGWTAELRIPFSQLDFPDREEQVWGINFSRRTFRHQERDELFHNPRDASGYMRRFPDLVGIRGIRPRRQLEVLTHAVGKVEMLDVSPENPFEDETEWGGNLGLDVTWGLSNDLGLNGTINPDFGQVEVDPAVVNLSDFETFFEERRPFFVKDANTFRFGREGTNNNWNFNWMDPLLFYSRRVGREPQVSLEDHDHAEVPAVSTILGAGKLSGKVGETSIGVLSAVTAEEKARLDLDGARSEPIAEPLSNYTVVRASRTGAGGRRGLGLMGTRTWRDLSDSRAREELPRSALAGGLDGWTTLDGDAVWAVRGYVAGSRVSGDEAAIDLVQDSSTRYFGRPGADHLDYDSTRTSLSGWAGRVMLDKESGNVTLNTALGGISPGFEINDLGFQNRADNVNWHMAAGYRWLEPKGILRGRSFNLASYRTWDFGGNPDAHGYGLFHNTEFTNYWAVDGMFFYNPPRTSLRATRGGPPMHLKYNFEGNLGIGTDPRKDASAYVWGSLSRQGDGSESASGLVSLTFRPRSSLSLEVSPELSWFIDTSQWIDNVDDPEMTATFGTRHVFGRLDYRELTFTTRVDWTFTPGLTLQTYVQPLFAVGRYGEFKEFARPNTYDFDTYGESNGSTLEYDPDSGEYAIDPDGPGPAEPFSLSDPDFNFKSLKVNMVLRWEYRPGSTAYLVWTQGRTNSDDPGDFELGRDADSLLHSPSEDVVLLKVTTWFDL